MKIFAIVSTAVLFFQATSCRAGHLRGEGQNHRILTSFTTLTNLLQVQYDDRACTLFYLGATTQMSCQIVTPGTGTIDSTYLIGNGTGFNAEPVSVKRCLNRECTTVECDPDFDCLDDVKQLFSTVSNSTISNSTVSGTAAATGGVVTENQFPLIYRLLMETYGRCGLRYEGGCDTEEECDNSLTFVECSNIATGGTATMTADGRSTKAVPRDITFCDNGTACVTVSCDAGEDCLSKVKDNLL
jgi:hypothetical protein